MQYAYHHIEPMLKDVFLAVRDMIIHQLDYANNRDAVIIMNMQSMQEVSYDDNPEQYKSICDVLLSEYNLVSELQSVFYGFKADMRRWFLENARTGELTNIDTDTVILKMFGVIGDNLPIINDAGDRYELTMRNNMDIYTFRERVLNIVLGATVVVGDPKNTPIANQDLNYLPNLNTNKVQ